MNVILPVAVNAEGPTTAQWPVVEMAAHAREAIVRPLEREVSYVV
jgi:hypothetical protein